MVKPVLAARRSVCGVLAVAPVAAAASNWWEPSGSFTVQGAWNAKNAASAADALAERSGEGSDLTGSHNAWDVNDGLLMGFPRSLDTGLTPGADWTIFCRFSDATTAYASIFGQETSGANFYLRNRSLPNVEYVHGVSGAHVSGIHTSGSLCIAGDKAYRDGVDEGVTLASFTATALHSIMIGARNSSGGAINHSNIRWQYFAVYSNQLSAAQVAELHANTA